MTTTPAVRPGVRPGIADTRSARQRLLDAANELFYAEGVQTVGIDRIIAKAGVAKASLYNTFGSKDELIRAYLAARHDGTTRRLVEVLAMIEDPRDKLLAVYDVQGELFRQVDFRGCAFVASAACSMTLPWAASALAATKAQPRKSTWRNNSPCTS
jgi:AcrR family transcriptional regulator